MFISEKQRQLFSSTEQSEPIHSTGSGSARSKSLMPGEPFSGMGHPVSPSTLERPLKTGWLKKQRSIVKNWQMRFFVLKGQYLYYYKDEKDSMFQGSILLQGSQVNELASNPEEPGKFLFEIIPGSCGDRERTSQDSHVLMANSQNEMEEWVKTLRRMMGVPASGVFGQSLADTVMYEQKFGQHLVPILVVKCAEFILEHGLSEEGIFRLPGQDNQVKQFRDTFDAGERPSFPSDTDVHTVASLFKLYLRELPEPVIPWSQYEDFLNCSTEGEVGQEQLENQIALLPRANYSLLSYICRFLYEIQLNSSVNKMSVENLATVIGVNLLKPKIEDPVTIMKGTPQIQKVMTVMISRHQELFPKSKDATPASPLQKSESKRSNAPRSFVGWDVAEDPSSGKEDTIRTVSTHQPFSSSGQTPTNTELNNDQALSESVENLSSPSCSAAEGPGIQSTDRGDLWTASPRKRTQTLPSRKPSFGSQGEAEGGRAGVLNEDMWNLLGTSPPSSDPDKRTLSEDIFKILDLQRVSLFPSSTMTGENDCSAANGPVGKVTEAAGKQTEICSFTPKSLALQTRGLKSLRATDEDENKAGGQEVPGNSLLGREVELRKETERQKSLYEAHISSLEKTNCELSVKVSELRESLAEERKRSSALEIRLRNVEWARDEAEKRNKALDKEIQEFLTKTPAS
ncbi:rho GTPase-activating protein 25-like isoform X2 [Polyodon spathula]|uniref:rho GTPase-activating protein 25-like isoform X2 n=1 Tax=Polyodon spathula TaxID=7913 RepID=UPI001B7F5459|nr:rho GTPase-activating protein 25-like isoform X2 [Polyodon spathula]